MFVSALPMPLTRPFLTTTEAKWDLLDNNAVCNIKAGEKYIKSSQDLLSIAACQKGCEEHPGCQSIMFRKSTRWCSFYSTQCKSRSKSPGAISMKLLATTRTTPASRTTTPAPTTTPGGPTTTITRTGTMHAQLFAFRQRNHPQQLIATG